MFDFRDYSKKEKIEREEKRKEIEAATREAAETLRACITSDTFKKYREELETCDKALVETGIGIMRNIRNKDERLALYDMLFARADVLSLLLKSVEKDKA